jgi:hypothetical protein
MAMWKDLKARMADYMKGKGVDAPEDFLAPEPMMEGGEMMEEEMPAVSIEQKVMEIKSSPDFNLVDVIKMLIEEAPEVMEGAEEIEME